MNFILRKATKDDSDFLFILRNEESVRAVSLNSDPISRETHERWFEKKLNDKSSLVCIAETEGGEKIGQVRYDVLREEAEASIAIAGRFRGKGYGVPVLTRSVALFWELFQEVTKIQAFINLDNEVSLRVFGRAGYQSVGTSTKGGLLRNEMILKRPPR